jgi:hypothetical protein
MKRSDVFHVIEPPPNGWTRLHAQLEQRPPRRWAWALAVAAALLLAVVLWPRAHEVPVTLTRSMSAVALGFDAHGPALAALEGAAEAVPSSDPNVLLFRIAMVEAD